MNRRTWLLALLSLAWLAGCSNSKTGSNDPADGSNGDANKKRIGLSVQSMANPYFKLVADVVKEQAEKNGFIVEIRDGKESNEEQNNQVKEFINGKFDAIIICPRDTKAVGQSVREANDAGIPVFTIDTICEDDTAEVVFHVGTDNEQGGHVAGRAMIDALKSRGGGNVAILQLKEAESCVNRVKGFTAEIEAHNKKGMHKINIVSHFECGGKQQGGNDAARDALRGKEPLAGIFAINDPAALGAIAALESEGKLKDIVVVGFDGQPAAKQAVKDGKLFDTPVQFPRQMAIECVKAIVKHFDGEKLEPVMLIPTKPYRREDALKDASLK